MSRGLKAFRAKYDISVSKMAETIKKHERTYTKKEKMDSFEQGEMIAIRDYLRRYEKDVTIEQLFFD